MGCIETTVATFLQYTLVRLIVIWDVLKHDLLKSESESDKINSNMGYIENYKSMKNVPFYFSIKRNIRYLETLSKGTSWEVSTD